MSDVPETHCRLCAEPTMVNQLISMDDDAGLNSKIKTKMLWINVDVSPSNILPKAICFSCFDLLERTWSFLHEVRSAQNKLFEIYDVKCCKQSEIGKPVNANWNDFVKTELDSSLSSDQACPEEKTNIKLEPNYSNDLDLPYHSDHSSDSEIPLTKVAEKKIKAKRKKKKKYDEEIYEDELEPLTSEGLPIDMSAFTMTWDDYTWCCASCEAQCKSVDLLRLHALEIHNTCCSFKCSDCTKIITNYKLFITHVQMHYKSLRYHCDFCNKHYKLSSLVGKHRKSHTEYSNMCRSCGSSFENQELLEDHISIFGRLQKRRKVELPEEELKCNECNREFKSKSNLQAHKLVHTQRSREFSCHVCGKMFFTKGALSTHMATHEETKPFKCEFCSLSFRARGNLTSHITMHSGAKPFVCEQCGKSFRVKRHLKSHSIVHTDLMPYECEYCSKKFRFKTRLNLHVRQHTGAKPYNCVYCRRDFTNGSNYKKHMYRRHNIDTSVRKKDIILVNQTESKVEINE